ncbi:MULTISPECIES: helix-turn-helix domain-containing protein [Rhizobium]|jgi:transcriptional regulator with XRE-family HTH domain|uniref:Helix-turn-helix domain-containing protein n=1 Tax=Rhizobium anhuiense TaxID=1184720 RepID=A0A3S0XUA5_9HYPH|nr:MULTISPECIES: helix-turn-helix domain-containing protein [Rhizobium]KZS50865.1 Cro/Cl family transcriptional regulator [Rhizobium anhuiense bv. trifolii]MBB3298527.1 transcriptional regulator with XRE-family HTH domain [Rhizobium sp. BK112]MBB3367565.1 transcriptional regulator with XRE-family HTH domain [Rhizobium sp. BK077]MBB3742363.1 transcriptional regulator with XRE-family HTH domain [Rhizobium sp. BK591]MBB4178419.1 transcriptional regulator with XRE-family HTH domain [Rhizobium sp. 
MNVKTPNAIDSYVGARIRMRRQLLGMSQERLAEQIGVTFQQVQKYEKGINRIGASRLQRIADVLHTSVSFFFEQENSEPLTLQGLDLSANSDPVAEFLRTKEGLVLNRAFLKIADRNIRETVIALVKAMAQAESHGVTLGASIADVTLPLGE